MSRGLREEAVIRTPDRRLRVFVSYTLGEVRDDLAVLLSDQSEHHRCPGTESRQHTDRRVRVHQ